MAPRWLSQCHLWIPAGSGSPRQFWQEIWRAGLGSIWGAESGAPKPSCFLHSGYLRALARRLQLVSSHRAGWLLATILLPQTLDNGDGFGCDSTAGRRGFSPLGRSQVCFAMPHSEPPPAGPRSPVSALPFEVVVWCRPRSEVRGLRPLTGSWSAEEFVHILHEPWRWNQQGQYKVTNQLTLWF